VKKIILLGYFIFFITIAGSSQLYFRFGGGIGKGFPYYDPAFTSSKGRAVTPVNSSLGTGGNVNVALSWMINKYIGTEIAINEFYGVSVFKRDYIYTSSFIGTYEETRWGLILQFIPSVIITPGLNKVNPYARLGLIIGALPQIYQKNQRYEVHGWESSEDNYYYGGISLGFAADLGVEFKLIKVIIFFSEIDFNFSRYSPKYGVYDDGDPNYDNVKNDLINSTLSFSNFQFNLGLKFLLGY
jgi:hypothetical protein